MFKAVDTTACRGIESEVRSAVQWMAKNGDVDWVITVGGIGFGEKDVTPEVS